MGWQQHDLNAYEARRMKAKFGKETGFGVPVKRESDLHAQILEECKRRGWLAFHGSMAHNTYRTLGEPDLTILCDGGKVLLVECKADKGKLSTDQLAVAAWAKRLGHVVHVVRSFEEFLKL